MIGLGMRKWNNEKNKIEKKRKSESKKEKGNKRAKEQ
jgi:hypothetical protein